MKRLTRYMSATVVTGLYAPQAFASALKDGANLTKPGGGDSRPTDLGSFFGTAADVLIYLTGAIAVLIIVYGGFRYVTSTGDATRVKQAKDTILYGVIGLVIALLAFALVNFIIGNI